MDMLSAIKHGDFATAESIRKQFCGLEDLRNSIQPIRVLHRALELRKLLRPDRCCPCWVN